MGKWSEKCIVHYGEDAESFFSDYFSKKSRSCLVIGGAGFDPRSENIVKKLSGILGRRLATLMIRENRFNSDTEMVRRANLNLNKIKQYCNNTTIKDVDIFSTDDDAVVGGRNMVSILQKLDCTPYTDIILDMSALSLGISFPIASFIYEYANSTGKKLNFHIALMSNPTLEQFIHSEPHDQVSDAQGFRQKSLLGEEKKAILWLPLLTERNYSVLDIIRNHVTPHDTYPILPFPSDNPKLGDEMAFSVFKSAQSDFGGPLENDWGLDPQNFLYSDERIPLDIYRSILRLADGWKEVFEPIDGSTIILSPQGSKIPTVGALMAALECHFPVVYIEALSYTVKDWQKVDYLAANESQLTHIWLGGEAY